MQFKPVSSSQDFIALEKELLEFWQKEKIVEKYLTKNSNSDKKFSFLDGPITANNPMGVHHAWGRTYKDLWQRFFNMKGYKERFQNGFDEQGLWVEVNVEKDLGLNSKRDIENLVAGDKFASLEKFVNLCKERVAKYSKIQTEQSERLGYFMDWENSYHTSSEENNYAIWNFLKVVNEKGWLYKGHDSVPWCPRCGTAISQHEILTEEYKELTHESVYLKLPIKNRENEYLVVWTTTPWTIPANVAIAVNTDKNYLKVKDQDQTLYLMRSAADHFGLTDGVEFKGQELVGLEYDAPFDNLDRVAKSLEGYSHRVVATDEMILSISEEEGTGLVHIAPGAGSEDFKLAKKLELPLIEVIDEQAEYLDGLGEYSFKNAKKHPELIIDFLKSFQDGKFLYKTENYKHRYPTCWRCKTELVWRVVDEWYISMDKADDSGQTYRQQMVSVAEKINWLPTWGLDRELDWLKNMHDWLISKKRYWGLSLPIWVCLKCDNFEVIGSKDELKEKATEGWEKFEGHTPHRPWIDQVKIKCSNCGEISERIPDVGNPWLDAGIVPFSTLPEDYFPANFITESFPGQFKNWFYSLIAMSAALKRTNPFETVLGYASVRDEKGEEMHKSKGNSIEFNEAADKIGVDVMRWMYISQNPEYNLNFGYQVADEVRRRFYLILWNSYKYFVDYATVSDWSCELTPKDIKDKLTVLDRWILSRLTGVVLTVNQSLVKFDGATAARVLEEFVVEDFSKWYIRRSRDRVGPAANPEDQNLFLSTSYGILVNLSKLLAPFVPFISEEIYRNLTGELSVHLEIYPEGDESLRDLKLESAMSELRKLAELGKKQRQDLGINVRQPLSSFGYEMKERLVPELEAILASELNVKSVEHNNSQDNNKLGLNTNITPELKEEGETRDLVRQIQQKRKELGLTLKDSIKISSAFIPKSEDLKQQLLKQTNATEILEGPELTISIS